MTRETELTEHLIRLRGGWECGTSPPGSSPARRLSLPVQWTTHETGVLTLTRRFGRPAIDHDRESLWLRLDQVAGLCSLRLNGQPLAQISPIASDYAIPLPALLDRNQLDLEVDVPAAASAAASGAEWGVISLVVCPRDDCT